MPIYVRKNLLSVSAESLSDYPGSREEDFISDPDQIVDSLPQPFRLINKLLSNICDNAWERISSKAAAEEAKQRQVMVPVYEDVEVINQYGDCPAVVESPNGNALFLGLPDELIALDPVTYTPLASSRLEGQEPGQRSQIASIMTVQIDVQTCLIISISKSGFGRLHIFASPLLLPIKDLDTEIPAGSSILEGCAFNDGEFLGLTVKGKEGDIWLDILKLPKENWLKALEDHRCSKPVETENISSQPSSQHGSPIPVSWNTSNLAKPVQVLRVTAPLTTVSATTNTTLPGVNTMPALDEWPDTIGVGSRHLQTEQQLKMRRAAAEVELAARLGSQPKSMDYQSRRSDHCSWLVLNKGPRIHSSAVGSSNGQYLVCSWSYTSYLCYYDLHKTSKDVERKPDRVVPFGANVTALTATPCGILLAVGLSDGSVILYDEIVGLPLFVERAGSTPIQFLMLPAGSSRPTALTDLSDLTKGHVTVITGGQDGSITALTLDYGSRHVNKVTVQPKGEELQTMTMIKSLHNVLLIMSKDGAVSLLDFQTGEVLCRVSIPAPYNIDKMELDNVLSLAASDQQLLMKATVISDEGSLDNTVLLAYKLQFFSCLDSRWKTVPEQEDRPPTPLHTTSMNKQIDWLLNKQLQTSHTRQLRIQQRWEQLRSGNLQSEVSA